MKRFSPKTIARALLYIRTLEHLVKQKKDFVSSRSLAQITGLTDVQIRKDISNFGKVGTPRIGYRTAELKSVLEDFVLQKKTVHVALFGVGNLGAALLKYPGFRTRRVKVVAAFDVEPSKIGRKIGGVKIYPLDRARQVIRKVRADVGIMAVPSEQSQRVADLMVAAGLRGIANFAPASINVPRQVRVKNIDLTIEFLSLFCNMHR